MSFNDGRERESNEGFSLGWQDFKARAGSSDGLGAGHKRLTA